MKEQKQTEKITPISVLQIIFWYVRKIILPYNLKWYSITVTATNLTGVILSSLPILLSAKILDKIIKLLSTSSINDMSDILHKQEILTLIIANIAIILLSSLFKDIVDYMDRSLYQNMENASTDFFSRIIYKFSPADIANQKVNKNIILIRQNIWEVREVLKKISDIISTTLGLTYFLIILLIKIRLIALLWLTVIVLKISFSLKYSYNVWTIWSSHKFTKLQQIYSSYRNAVMWWNSYGEFAMLKILGIGDYFMRKAYRIYEKFIRLNQKYLLKQTVTKFLTDTLNGTVYFISFLGLIQMVIHKKATAGDILFLSTIFTNIFDLSSTLAAGINRLYASFNITTKLKILDEHKVLIKNNPNAISIKTANAPKIEFKDVSFRYPDSKNFVLKDLNFTINPQEAIAIVGKNGAGKTTLIKLLLRFYDVTSGEILINGINIKKLNLDDYYKLFGVLAQGARTYSVKVKDNIWFGDINKEKNFNLIKKSAQIAGADEFIEKLKDGYDTYLSLRFKNGVELSGGQDQKITIAAQFFRDPKVLILDEPTSSIDALSEFKIFKNIYERSKNKTIVIISHRFSTVKIAQRIIVLDKGKITETGSHKNLLKNNGLYAKMYRSQILGKDNSN